MRASSFILSPGNFSTLSSNYNKCLSVIDTADKTIRGSSEALANSMSQSHHWVNFVPSKQICYYYYSSSQYTY